MKPCMAPALKVGIQILFARSNIIEVIGVIAKGLEWNGRT